LGGCALRAQSNQQSVTLRDRDFQRDPPQLARALREFGGDVDRKGASNFRVTGSAKSRLSR